MDQELVIYLNDRFHETKQQLLRLEGSLRETRSEIKGLRADMQQLGGELAGKGEELKALALETRRYRDDLRIQQDLSDSSTNCRLNSLEEWRDRVLNEPIARIREQILKK